MCWELNYEALQVQQQACGCWMGNGEGVEEKAFRALGEKGLITEDSSFG